RCSFVLFLWPFLEQQSLYDRYDFSKQPFEPPNSSRTVVGGSTETSPLGSPAQLVSLYFCPSDRAPSLHRDNYATFARGNYALNYGNRTWGYDNDANGATPPAAYAPFAALTYSSTSCTLSEPNYKSFTDGLSKTVLMSEMIVPAWNGTTTSTYPAQLDFRATLLCDNFFFTPSWVSNAFMTINTPNSSVPDVNGCQPATDTDPKTPCSPGADSARQAAARSRHAGGVITLLGDGAVTFVSDSIASAVWRAVGTMNGGESLSLD
ncbi:MAG: DUF1559 domain-containing protein, partial [Planctomycetia bacterium]